MIGLLTGAIRASHEYLLYVKEIFRTQNFAEHLSNYIEATERSSQNGEYATYKR